MIDLMNQVWEELGPGYSEAIYHNALEVLLRLNGIQYETERIIPVEFRGHVIGNLRADIILSDCIIELKSVRSLSDANRDQIRTYMRILGHSHGYLVNFGPELQIEEVML